MRKVFRSKDQKGQTMVEFALVLPVLLMLILGVIQFGIAFNNYLAVTDAVRAGARKGSVARFIQTGREDAVRQVVHDAADNLDTSKMPVTVVSSWEAGEPVTVTATYPYQINLLGIVVKSGDLSSTTTERVE
jgi:Flp pilus assembly protein TadG